MKGRSFPLKADLFMLNLLLHRERTSAQWSQDGNVCSCLFVWDENGKKWFSLLAQSSFLNTFGVFFSSGSVAICVCVWLCLCVWLPQLHFVDDAVTAVGILDASQSLSRQKQGTIYLLLRQTHTHKYTHTRPVASSPPFSSPMCGLGGLSGL